MKLTSIFSVITICVFTLFSCGGTNSENLPVQKEFFGATFGDSKETVCEKMIAQNFQMTESDSEAKVRWCSNDSIGNISFGGRDWTRFTTYFHKGKFGEIRFYIDCQDNEDDAETKYDQLKKTLEKKYGSFEKVSDKKENIISLYEHKCNDGKIVLSLQEFTTNEGVLGIGKKYSYQVGLTYVLSEVEQESISEF